MKNLLITILTVLLFTGCAQAQDGGITLAKDQHTSYVIALAADAIPAEKTAAQQLQHYLQEVTGAIFPILPAESVQAEAPQILVGQSERVKVLLPQQDWKSLGEDGIVIKTVGNKLILAGGRPRGTLYAVFQFLEESVGCHWWTPKESTIPHKSTLVVSPQNVTYVPPFNYREYFTAYVQTDPVFATLVRQNGDSQKQTSEWGGHHQMLGSVHTFSKLLPPEKYFKEHPEWYSDPANGHKPCTATSKMPQAQHTQISLSNPEVVEELTKQALLWIKQNPDAGYISISQNDSGNFCQTPESIKLYKQEGSWSGPLLHFVNQVAEKIHQQYPNFLVETLAYSRSIKPPKTIRPAPNVIIRLASLHADAGHPMNSEWNQETRDNLLQWSKISNQLFVWNYVTNFYGYMLPHPNWGNLATDLRFFAANKVTGIFLEGTHRTNNGVGDFTQLRVWLMSKLMWNPQLNQSQLTDEFLQGYYGAAAPYLRGYLDLVEQAFVKSNRKLGAFNIDWTFLTLQDMNQATRFFDQAANAVKNDPIISVRIQRERLSLDLLWFLRYKPLKRLAEQSHQDFLGPKDPAQAVQEFIATAKHLGVARYSIDRSFNDVVPALQRMFNPSVALPDFAKQYPANDVIDIQEGDFSLYHYGKESTFEEDPAASNRQAAATSLGWGIQAELNQALPGPTPEKYHVYAMVRAAKGSKLDAENKVGAGIYDVTTSKGITSQVFTLSGDNYQRIDLGVHDLGGSMYIWFSPAGKPAAEKVYVDRIILIREKS